MNTSVDLLAFWGLDVWTYKYLLPISRWDNLFLLLFVRQLNDIVWKKEKYCSICLLSFHLHGWHGHPFLFWYERPSIKCRRMKMQNAHCWHRDWELIHCSLLIGRYFRGKGALRRSMDGNIQFYYYFYVCQRINNNNNLLHIRRCILVYQRRNRRKDEGMKRRMKRNDHLHQFN